MTTTCKICGNTVTYKFMENEPEFCNDCKVALEKDYQDTFGEKKDKIEQIEFSDFLSSIKSSKSSTSSHFP